MMHRPPQGKEPSNVGQREQSQSSGSQGERMSFGDEMKSASEASGFGSDSASAKDVVETETPASMSSQDAQGSEGQSREGGPFLMGYHSFNSLEDVDIPQYVRDHNATLTFPEKVREPLPPMSGRKTDITSDYVAARASASKEKLTLLLLMYCS